MRGLVPLSLLIFLLMPLPSEVGGIRSIFRAFYEWSRKVFDFTAATPVARKFFGSTDHVTTQYLISKQGYPVETHQVITEDGYILEVHRIQYGINSRRPQPKELKSRVPVLLFHGNAQSSADWVINQPVDDALGFFLADSGYDVWLGNQRGNDYSDKHVSLTPADSKFWDYSVHQIGVYDITAIIDHIIKTTGHARVNFIGFSLSNAAIMVTLAKRPEYNYKLGGAVLMAPGGIYYEGFFFGIAKLAAPLASLYEIVGPYLGGIPLLPPFFTNLLHRVLPVVCHRKVDIFGICLIVLKTMFGNDLGLITKDKMSLITSVAPSPFSLGTFIHGMQQAGFGEFTEYDYGIRKNKMIYGSTHPPKYNLTNVKAPIAIMVGPGDYHANPRDARRLARQLPNLVDFHYVPYSFFRHLDFCYARGAGKLVYPRVVSYLDAYSNAIRAYG